MASSEFKYDNSIRGIVERIAFELGDALNGDEFANYDENWIRARVYDTFKWLQGRRPSLFAETVEVELVKGDRQELPEDCDRLIDGLTLKADGKEYPAYRTSQAAIQSARALTKLVTCPTPLCYFHVAADEHNVDSFWVSPPVPPNSSWSVELTCSSMESFFNDEDKLLDCEAHKWVNTVIEYVKHLALSSEREQGLSEQHRATFFDLAPVQRRES